MTDLLNGLDASNGRSNVFQAGLHVFNAKEDQYEISSRQRTGSHAVHSGKAHFIFPGELCMVRTNKKPMMSNDNAAPQSDIEVFTNFDGVTETQDRQKHSEQSFRLVGISRNRPMHQDMNGRDRGGRFAVQTGGLRTIPCHSADSIPVFSPVLWMAPSHDLPDPKNLGRKLAEVGVFSQRNNKVTARTIHQTVSRIMHGETYSLGGDAPSERSGQADAQIIESLGTIAFSSALLAFEHLGMPMTDDTKLALAQSMGVIPPQDENERAGAAAFRQKLVNTLFSAEYDPMTGVSHETGDYVAFPIGPSGVVTSGGVMQRDVSGKQITQFDTLVTALFAKDREARDRIFGIAMTSGKPGKDFDVLIVRG